MKSVAFLFAESTGGITPVATAFFVGVPVREGRPEAVVYIVTARHVIDASRPHGMLRVRLRRRDGTADAGDVPQDHWTPHPTADVAVATFAGDWGLFDYLWIPFEALITDERMKEHQIGPGDDLFFVGLFSPYPGLANDQPLLRFGTVAMIPPEPIPVKMDPASDTYDAKMEAYLAEVRSWGGQSGSPAFVLIPERRTEDQLPVGLKRMEIIGLVHGHYEIAQEVRFVGDIAGSGEVPVNAGVAIVIPAQKIVDTLRLPEFMEQRARLAASLS